MTAHLEPSQQCHEDRRQGQREQRGDHLGADLLGERTPFSTALPASSGPSVGIRMFLNKAALLPDARNRQRACLAAPESGVDVDQQGLAALPLEGSADLNQCGLRPHQETCRTHS